MVCTFRNILDKIYIRNISKINWMSMNCISIHTHFQQIIIFVVYSLYAVSLCFWLELRFLLFISLIVSSILFPGLDNLKWENIGQQNKLELRRFNTIKIVSADIKSFDKSFRDRKMQNYNILWNYSYIHKEIWMKWYTTISSLNCFIEILTNSTAICLNSF